MGQFIGHIGDMEVNMSPAFSYSIAVFLIIMVAGCAVNLLKQHYLFQLLGIAFFFTYLVINSAVYIESASGTTFQAVFYRSLPSLFGISACLISMTLGFWIFPAIRSKVKD
jgi:hypothetical protein